MHLNPALIGYHMKLGGACDIMIIVVWNGLDEPSSNLGQGCLHFT